MPSFLSFFCVFSYSSIRQGIKHRKRSDVGFMEAVEVTDFPIRDHKVILVIRRRRWTDVRTGKSFSIPIGLDIACKGTRYSKEFGAFLKEMYGDIPRDLPYA